MLSDLKDSSGKQFYVNTGSSSTLGIPVPSGADSRLITIPSKGEYTLEMYLVGRGMIDFNKPIPGSMKFSISDIVLEPQAKSKVDSTKSTKSSKDTTKDVKSQSKKTKVKSQTKSLAK